MFLPVIMLIITTLIVSSISSIISLKTNQYELLKKGDKIQEFVFQEKMIKEAVDSYCRVNFAVCSASTKSTNEIIIPLNALTNYYPKSNLSSIPNSFSEVKLRTDTKEIFLTHSIDLQARKDYNNHYANNLQNISCTTGEALPCTGTIVKKIKYSEELQILYVNDLINDKNLLININLNLISAENLKPIPDLVYIDSLNQSNSLLNQEIVVLNSEKDVLNLIITNRKLKGWG